MLQLECLDCLSCCQLKTFRSVNLQLYNYTGLKKKNLNSSLSIGQTALKFCLHWASLSLLFYSCSLQMTCNCLGPCPYRTSKKEELIAWQENLQLDSSIFFYIFHVHTVVMIEVSFFSLCCASREF